MPDTMFIRAALALAFTMSANLIVEDAKAQPFVHPASGIKLPASVDGMNINAGKAGLFGEFARTYTYSNGPDRIEMFVIRASYPNASIWFSSATDHVKTLLAAGKPTDLGKPQLMSISSNKPNAIIAAFRFEQFYTSASIAVIGFDKWIVIVQSVSKELDPEAQSARMAVILPSIGKAEMQASYLPLVLIESCPEGITEPSELAPLSNSQPPEPQIELKTAGGLAAMLASKDAYAEGESGLANRPDLFCKAQSTSGITKWFRPIVEQPFLKWISTVKITGLTMQGMAIPSIKDPEGMTGAVITNDFEKSSVASFSDAAPDPVQSQMTGLAGLMGNPKYAFVRYGTNDLALVGENDDAEAELTKQ